ncbi:MAG: alcohol dehydrogenase catalytic domain-containing protein, partial [Chloroflexia bacterium]|nr:alcohol dehydrogenase catalytic domain-containing protein [Chloroflexia bacterium]
MSNSGSVRAVAIRPDQPHTVHPVSLQLYTPGPGQVEIDVVRVGVCGTDREIIAGEIGFPPLGLDELVIGHEVVGRVTAVGSSVNDIAVGDLVTVTVRRPDDCAACRSGEPDMCTEHRYVERGIAGAHGFMAERVIEDEEWVIKVPDRLEPIAVLTEPLTVVEKAVRQARLIQRRLNTWEPKTAVVLGAGPIGLLGTMLLRSQGIDVYTAARTPAPNPAATLVEACGATYVSTRDTPLLDVAAGLPRIDIVLECSGASRLMLDGMDILGNNGVMVLLSLTPEHDLAEAPVGRINRSM